MANITDYMSGYGTPQSQGPQGQQGASGQNAADSIYNPTRAPLWKPAPASSQSQPTSQTSGAGQRFQQEYGSAGSGQAASGSPVTANGQIAPAQQPATSTGSAGSASSQPSAGSAPSGQNQTQPATTGPPLTQMPPDPFQAMGGGFWTGQQWVPKNHPLAQQTNQPSAPGGAQPQPAQYSPYGPYPGRPQGTTYDPGTLSNPQFQSYQGTQFQGYGGVDQSGIQNQQNQLLSQILSNPAMSASVVEQMKAKQRESAMAMGGQQQQMAAQNAASRGTNLDTQFNTSQNEIGNSMRENILGSYRDIDINAALTNRQGQLDALGMSDNVLSGQVGRQGQQYASYLNGQGAMQGENQARFDNQFKPAEFNMARELQQEGLRQAGAASQMGAYQTDLGAFFDNRAADNADASTRNQRDIGMGSLDIDRTRVNNQASQFDRGHQLDWASLMNDMYMGRAGLGVNYAELQQRGQQDMMRTLFPNGFN
jgi:hypothetical protein